MSTRVITWDDLGKGCTCLPSPSLEEQMRSIDEEIRVHGGPAPWRKMCRACSAVMTCLEADEPTQEEIERALRLTGQLVEP